MKWSEGKNGDAMDQFSTNNLLRRKLTQANMEKKLWTKSEALGLLISPFSFPFSKQEVRQYYIHVKTQACRMSSYWHRDTEILYMIFLGIDTYQKIEAIFNFLQKRGIVFEWWQISHFTFIQNTKGESVTFYSALTACLESASNRQRGQ